MNIEGFRRSKIIVIQKKDNAKHNSNIIFNNILRHLTYLQLILHYHVVSQGIGISRCSRKSQHRI